eukprot:TRINITY_DN25845_c0_g1_i1.p1 TRINITY_DN25845_c0_g1~~TRINITY_DN25845_c0_g1_i1.p1  ORF type:complete len:873 (+),score=299.53 TRINITY_DN25845_c0_g1_i1:117-2735(+)
MTVGRKRGHRLLEGSEHFVVLLHCILLGFVLHYHNWLPEAKGLDASEEEFSSARAMAHLKYILGTGVRTVGSRANEAVTPEYIISQVKAFNASSHPETDVHLDVQWPSGGFATGFLGGFVNTYHRVVNVVVKVTPQGAKPDAPALLVSAHFDSSLGTVGASDDCANIAAMLEILRLVMKDRLVHPIVFNFNGAEETNWQAAHGFITQHPWARNLRAQVNLEASGTGGREIVIQNGPKNAWIGRTYVAKVPYPHAHGVAQLIFESGVLPAQTDFQTYRDFHPVMPKLPGMDFAVVQDGHVYHTPQDDYAHVDPRHVQRLGDNIYALVTGLASSPYLADPGDLKDESDTTFDIAGLGVVSYSKTTGRILNFLALTSGVYIAWRTPFGVAQRESGAALHALRHGVLPAFGMAVLSPLCVAACLTLIGLHISWYSHTWNAYVLYTLPSIVSQAWVYHRYAETFEDACQEELRSSRPLSAFDALLAANALWAWVLVLPFALLDHTLTTFMFLVWFIPLYLRLLEVDGMSWPSFALSCTPGLALWWQMFATTLGFFLPLTGRIGNAVPPNLIVGVMSGIIMGFAFLYPAIAVVHFGKAYTKSLLKGSSAIFMLGVFAALVVIPVYTTERPKRLFIQHVSRAWHDESGKVLKEDSGLWVNPMDYNGLSTLFPVWPGLRSAPTLTNRCSKTGVDLYCDTPWFFPVAEMLGGGKWLAAEAPDVPRIKLTHSVEVLPGGARRVTFEAVGPTHMAAIIGQQPGMPHVKAWSFAGNMIPPRADCNCHWVFHSQGAPPDLVSSDDFAAHGKAKGATAQRYEHPSFNVPRVWKFWLELEGDAKLDLAVYGHYLDSPVTNAQSKEIQSIPEWASEIMWISTWGSYKI